MRKSEKKNIKDFCWLGMLIMGALHWTIARVSPEIIYNNGMSFGWGINKWIVAGMWLIFSLWLDNKKNLGWYLVMMGGAINLVDRFRLGAVRDYWRLPIVGVYNNINDWLIFVGFMLIIWSLWQKKSK